MASEMPWQGKTSINLEAPEGWRWDVKVPHPDYAAEYKVSRL